MGGRASKQKGSRNEYLVRDHMRTFGFEVDRVPSSGAAQGFKGDLRARKAGQEYLVEVKSRKSSFTKIYELLGDAESVQVLDQNEVPVADICIDPRYLGSLHEVPSASIVCLPRTAGMLRGTLRAYLQECDILALKDDRRPILYVRLYA